MSVLECNDSREFGLGSKVLPTHPGEGCTRQQLFPPSPALIQAQEAKRDDRQPEGSPRRFAPLFTQKRNVSKLFDSQPEHLTVMPPFAQQTASSTCSSSPGVGGNADPTASSTVTKPKRKRLYTERRREQCRSNQARYRDRQRGFTRDLEDRVHRLRESVQKLTMERYTLCYGVQTKNNVWNVVVEYFRIFRHGYLEMMPSDAISSAASSAVPNFQDQ